MFDIDLVTLGFFAASILIIVSFAAKIVLMKISHRKTAMELVQARMDYDILVVELQKAIEINNKRDLEQTDGFVKFISDSRDWAFQYISEVQEALKNFDRDVSKDLAYHKKFGKVNGENVHTKALDNIDKAYSELKNLLPKEE